MKSWIIPCALVSLLTLQAGLNTGCAAAGVGAAGAAAGIYYSERGAESLVKAPVDEVYDESQSVLHDMGIKITKTEIDTDGKSREITGTKGETEVTVKMESESAEQTQVEVIAEKSPVTWDKDFASKVLSRIIENT